VHLRIAAEHLVDRIFNVGQADAVVALEIFHFVDVGRNRRSAVPVNDGCKPAALEHKPKIDSACGNQLTSTVFSRQGDLKVQLFRGSDGCR
jgi:hypothetical protein